MSNLQYKNELSPMINEYLSNIRANKMGGLGFKLKQFYTEPRNLWHYGRYHNWPLLTAILAFLYWQTQWSLTSAIAILSEMENTLITLEHDKNILQIIYMLKAQIYLDLKDQFNYEKYFNKC